MKHKHADMIIEWANETGKQIQIKDGNNPRWSDCSIEVLIDTYSKDEQFRFKPREFNEGEWYPCVDRSWDECVNVFRGGRFYPYSAYEDDDRAEGEFKWIGESLGKLKFG